jgi:hypothetical protein
VIGVLPALLINHIVANGVLLLSIAHFFSPSLHIHRYVLYVLVSLFPGILWLLRSLSHPRKILLPLPFASSLVVYFFMTLYSTLLGRRMLETLLDESIKYDKRFVVTIDLYFFYQIVLGSYLIHPDSSTASKRVSLGFWLMYLCNTIIGILNAYIVLGEFAPGTVGPVGTDFGNVDTLAV